MNAKALKLENIFKSFGDVKVLKDINLEINEGEFVVFVGPSGCGKSTLLRIISGLEVPTEGDIIIREKLVNNIPASERDLSMVFQSYALYPHMSVKKNLSFGLENLRIDKSEIEERIKSAAKLLRIEELMARRPGQLSGGQRQRVAIGRSIVRKPIIFLFDEPLSNLDAELRMQMRVELSDLHEELGNTMIYVTHDQIEAMTLADRIVVLNDGQVIQEGSPRLLYNKPNSEFVAEFIGSPKMNMVPCNSQDGNIILHLDGDKKTKIKSPKKECFKMGVRSEAISFAELDKADITGRLVLCEYLGSEQFAYADCGNGILITVRFDPTTEMEIGSEVGLCFDHSDLHFFADNGSRIEP